MLAEINFLCSSFDRPTIEKSFSNMRTQKVEKSRNLGRVIKEKENGIVKSSHLRCELLEVCSLKQTQRQDVDRT